MMHTLTCIDCGEEMSGPDADSVTETMARHKAKKHTKAAK
jgi:hypothetical protein